MIRVALQPRCARAPALSPAAAIAPATAVEMHRFSHSRDQVGLFRAALFPLQTSSGQSQRAQMLGGRVTRGARAHERRKHASEIHAQLRVRAATASVLAPASDARTTHSTPRLASTALRSFARICSIAMFSPATKCPETHKAKASSHTLPWAPARVRLCDGGECPSAAPPGSARRPNDNPHAIPSAWVQARAGHRALTGPVRGWTVGKSGQKQRLAQGPTEVSRGRSRKQRLPSVGHGGGSR